MPEDGNLLEQLSCSIELHFNAVREFEQGRIPELYTKMAEEYFSSLNEKNLVTNPQVCK